MRGSFERHRCITPKTAPLTTHIDEWKMGDDAVKRLQTFSATTMRRGVGVTCLLIIQKPTKKSNERCLADASGTPRVASECCVTFVEQLRENVAEFAVVSSWHSDAPVHRSSMER